MKSFLLYKYSDLKKNKTLKLQTLDLETSQPPILTKFKDYFKYAIVGTDCNS